MTDEEKIQLALSHHRAGRLDEAEKIYRGILKRKSKHIDALNLLGALEGQRGRRESAVEIISRVIRLKPDLVTAHNNLGNNLRDLGRYDQAIAAFQKALKIQPDYAEGHNNLGIALEKAGRADDAVAAFREALRLQPGLAQANTNLANILIKRGQVAEAIAMHRRATAGNTSYPNAHSDFLYSLQFDADSDPQSIYDEHRRWNQLYAEPLKRFIRPHENIPDPQRRLRIGYLSADFYYHSVSQFFYPLIRSHDHKSYEIFCYSGVEQPDQMTELLRKNADAWRDTSGMNNRELAEKIREDKIDILIDLSGHTGTKRLEVFAEKPAPVQVNYLGYPATTGLTAMDYRLTDSLADPPGTTESFHSERLVRLLVCAWCYSPPDFAPPVSLAPQREIRFGSFNNFSKSSVKIRELWARILSEIPSSKLLLKSGGLREKTAQQLILSFFESRGISSERIQLYNHTPDWVSHLSLYNEMDISLDTFPYHGTTTTCEALWMGVPVVTLAGKTHVSRVGVSLLTNAGLPDLIAQTPEEYVAIAVNLARNRPRLADLRRTARSRLQVCPLMDAPRFARDVESAYRQMWRTWCETQKPGGDSATHLQSQLDVAISHHQAGRFPEAEKIYREILARKPDHADALHLLGVLKFQGGQRDIAKQLIGRAIAINPNSPDYYRNLGLVLLTSGEKQTALQSYQNALKLREDSPDAHVGAGQAFLQLGDRASAIAHLRRAAELAPDSREIQLSFADALQQDKRHEPAIDGYQRLIAKWPGDPATLNNLATSLHATGRTPEAIDIWRQALAAQPESELVFNNLAAVLRENERPDQMIELCREALSRNPGWAPAYRFMGDALYSSGQIDAGIDQYRAAINSRPDFVRAWLGLGHALDAVGELDESLAAFDRAIAIDPAYQDAHHHRLFTMLFHPGFDVQRIAREHRAWNDRFAKPLRKNHSHQNDCTPHRKLKIGYISPNFRAHCHAHFTLPLFSHHDHDQFEIHLYSDAEKSDAVTERIHGTADIWRDTARMSDEAFAEMIRQDQIDILVDLTLHMGGSRLLTFARKPAPVQVTWLGYPGTSGLDVMDYRLTDPFIDPPEQNDSIYSEQSVRLPSVYLCYDPSALHRADELPVAPSPAGASPITFGSLNDFRKISAQTLDLWADVLQKVPEAKLIVNAPAGNARRRVLNGFSARAVAPERIEFVDRQPQIQYMRTFNRIDICLDALPYNGHTTTLDSLWMGVPVVSLVGSTSFGRAGASLLENIGLNDLIARSPEEFVRIASDLAGNLQKLSDLRHNLRSRMEKSPLMDAEKFARDIETCYRQFWRTWCASAR